MAGIALGAMIEELRNELQEAMERGEGRSVRFGLGEVTLETEVEVTQDLEGTAGVKLWIFTGAEAKGGLGKTQTQKLTLKLAPKGLDGQPLDLGR